MMPGWRVCPWVGNGAEPQPPSMLEPPTVPASLARLPGIPAPEPCPGIPPWPISPRAPKALGDSRTSARPPGVQPPAAARPACGALCPPIFREARFVGKENPRLLEVAPAGGVPGAPSPPVAPDMGPAAPPRLAGEPRSISPGRAPRAEGRGTITGSLALQPKLTEASAAAAAAEGAALLPAMGDSTMLSLEVLSAVPVAVVSSEGGEVHVGPSWPSSPW
jgi:hypothetical protein